MGSREGKKSLPGLAGRLGAPDSRSPMLQLLLRDGTGGRWVVTCPCLSPGAPGDLCLPSLGPWCDTQGEGPRALPGEIGTGHLLCKPWRAQLWWTRFCCAQEHREQELAWDTRAWLALLQTQTRALPPTG